MEPAGHATAAVVAPVDLSRSAAPAGLSAPCLNGPVPAAALNAPTLAAGLTTPAGLAGAGLSLLPSLYGRAAGAGDYGVPASSGGDATECRLVEYRGERVAAFVQRSGELLLCLPQAFELFLKHLVGGLHTVYTKLKRLGISPIVCNVEQVRILRGLGAIQPGVNRCKLLACRDFDALYRDCTTASSRPGRPPKRSGILLGLASAAQHHQAGSAMPVLQAIKKLRPDGDFASTYANGEAAYDDSVDKTTLLLNCLRQQMADPMGRGQGQPGVQPLLANGRPESVGSRNDASSTPSLEHQRPTTVPLSHKTAAGPPELVMDDSCYMAVEQGHAEAKTAGPDGRSYTFEAAAQHANLPPQDRGATSDGSGRSGPQGDDSPDEGESSKGSCCRDELIGPGEAAATPPITGFPESLQEAALLRAYDVYSMEALLRNIQALLRVAADGARHHERQVSLEKAELGMEILRERELREKVEKQLAEEQKFRVLYQRRLRRERRSRRKVQEQLQNEIKRRLKAEESLRDSSTDNVRFVAESMESKDGSDPEFRLDAEQKMHDCAMSVYAPEPPRCSSPGR
ncbi:dachshund homolog 1 [Rhipicephalus sanguineus]|uniref:dachshund homolog 1 n=1 Tax=Rhipicephalus sanguineus TaxID=34632 RepID=UPI0018932241|nr:dachshund homolog 1 [Rhipicephalus sanguineus]